MQDVIWYERRSCLLRAHLQVQVFLKKGFWKHYGFLFPATMRSHDVKTITLPLVMQTQL